MNASRKASELEKFIEARLGDMGFELVEINHLGQYGRQVLELYCDRMDDDAISVGNCAEISKRLKHTLFSWIEKLGAPTSSRLPPSMNANFFFDSTGIIGLK